MKKAFTLVEIMITVVAIGLIIGLIAAMAIPVFHAIKVASIESRVKQGIRVEKEEWEYYKKYQTGNKSSAHIPPKVEEEVKLDGGEYIVIKDKGQIKEVVIDGETVYLIKKSSNP